ncbi:hypothetical protein ACTXT7_002622 [Hymenolepis weldensis]
MRESNVDQEREERERRAWKEHGRRAFALRIIPLIGRDSSLMHYPNRGEAALGRPTCVTFFNSRPDPTNATQCLVGTSTGWLALIDVETGKVVNKVPPVTQSPTGGPAPDSEFGNDPFTTQTASIDTNAITYPKADWGPRGIHAVTMYQTFSLAITGHEDRCIRFYDLSRQGGDAGNACVATVVTHLEAVTCLTVDPHDLYVLTGSHDSSIRLWDLESRACVQEMTCHRVKNNESVHAVAMHPTMPFAASAGADAVCKVYTSLVLESEEHVNLLSTPPACIPVMNLDPATPVPPPLSLSLYSFGVASLSLSVEKLKFYQSPYWPGLTSVVGHCADWACVGTEPVTFIFTDEHVNHFANSTPGNG